MLLKELVEPTIKQTKKFDSRSHGEEIGRGAFAVAKHDNSDPHMIRKLPHKFKRVEDYRDANFIYVKWLKDRNLSDRNPYFPRIYNFNYKIDEDGKLDYDMQMERLFELSSLSDEELISLVKRLFKDVSFYKDNIDINEYFSGNYGHAAFADLFQNIIVEDLNPINKIRDKNLIRAVNILKEIWKNYEKVLNIDINVENIMIRRGPYGPQIVFVDPFYIRKK